MAQQQKLRTDTQRLDELQALLRKRDEMHEFWFDKDAGIFSAGDAGGDDLRQAVDSLLDVAAPELKPITIHDLAAHRGLKSTTGREDSYSMADYHAVGLDILGGCSTCYASIAAYNAYPSKDGYWKCKDHIGDRGWTDAAEADRDLFRASLAEDDLAGEEEDDDA